MRRPRLGISRERERETEKLMKECEGARKRVKENGVIPVTVCFRAKSIKFGGIQFRHRSVKNSEGEQQVVCQVIVRSRHLTMGW